VIRRGDKLDVRGLMDWASRHDTYLIDVQDTLDANKKQKLHLDWHGEDTLKGSLPDGLYWVTVASSDAPAWPRVLLVLVRAEAAAGKCQHAIDDFLKTLGDWKETKVEARKALLFAYVRSLTLENGADCPAH
jgi:hypothetical protein